MTDLCFEEGAEDKTEQSFMTALQIHGECIDALQGLANLRILRARDAEGRELLAKVVHLLFNSEEIEPSEDFRK